MKAMFQDGKVFADVFFLHCIDQMTCRYMRYFTQRLQIAFQRVNFQRCKVKNKQFEVLLKPIFKHTKMTISNVWHTVNSLQIYLFTGIHLKEK